MSVTTITKNPGFSLANLPVARDLAALTASRPILVADDELDLLTGVKIVLEEQGLTVIGAEDGRDALHICQTQPLSLVISDIIRPYVDGFAMLEALRAAPKTRDLPFIFMTALDTPEDYGRAMAMGASAYLLKPFHPVELIELTQRVLLAYTDWEQPIGAPVAQHFPLTSPKAAASELKTWQAAFGRGVYGGKILAARAVPYPVF